MNSLVILFLMTLTTLTQCTEDTCSKDDPLCNEKEENKFKDTDQVQSLLDEIEVLRRTNLNKAHEEIKSLLINHPENPKALLLLSKIQRALYSRLHPKMRDIGRLELLNPSLNVLMKILNMPKEQLSDKAHAETAEFASANAMGCGNKTMSVMMLKTILERKNNPAIDLDSYRYYFEMLAEELYYDKQFSEAKTLIDNFYKMFPGTNHELKLLSALISRYNEVVNKEPFVLSHDILKKIKPKDDDQKREIIMFINDLETELRRQKRTTEVYTLFELCEELAVFPSKYQRPNMLFDNLKAQPVWNVEETGQEKNLMKIQENWTQIKKELTNLTSELEDDDWKENNNLETEGLYGQYFFLGAGRTSLPPFACTVTPLFCEIIKEFNIMQECALCEVKLEFIEPQAHIKPHCGPTNAKLRGVIPVSLSTNITTVVHNEESPFRMRVGDETIQWEEGKPSVLDTSFENEVWNRSGGPKLLLVIDFKHPELMPEDDILHPSNWDIVDVDGNAVYQMKPSVLS